MQEALAAGELFLLTYLEGSVTLPAEDCWLLWNYNNAVVLRVKPSLLQIAILIDQRLVVIGRRTPSTATGTAPGPLTLVSTKSRPEVVNQRVAEK